MNTEEKLNLLKSFSATLDTHIRNQAQHPLQLSPHQIDSSTLPEIDLVGQLMHHHDQIMAGVDSTYNSVQPVLEELSLLQTRKKNINVTLDSMTAMREVKRLSYGLGSSTAEICRNLNTYYQIKEKLHYCEKYVEKVQQEISKVEGEFKLMLEKELKKVNSENVSEVAKALNLIGKHSEGKGNGHSHDQLVNFYLQLLRKQLLKFQDDLLKIPIVGHNHSNVYIFFDIAKQIMKEVVTLLSTYRSNIVKIGGEESLHRVIVSVFNSVMSGIILEILVREKKYFEVDHMEVKKIGKDVTKFNEYFNEYCAICNQIQRLRFHVSEELPQTYPHHRAFLNELDMAINSSSIITLNSEATQLLKASTRSSFNQLLKKSVFVTSLWQFDFEFLEAIRENAKKTGNSVYQSQDSQDFLEQTFSIFSNAIEKSIQTLNILTISPLISFANHNLIQQDSFHAFNELFDRIMSRMPSAEPKYYTGLVILINSLIIMPNALNNQLENITIPAEMEEFNSRLNSELNELVEVCQFKSKETVKGFVGSIVESEWFGNDLRTDYKKCLQKWGGLAIQANQLFLIKASILHVSQITEQQFYGRKSGKLLTQSGVLNFQKQLRGIKSYYEGKGCSIHDHFKKLFHQTEALLAENEETYQKLLSTFQIQEKGQCEMLAILRAAKLG